jgi:putative Mg2+ transporter-C (MgtC) family protein
MPLNDWEILGRLLLALVLGGLIGLERESHGRPAGFRTHILVSLGAALVMLLSVYAFSNVNARLPPGGFTYDPGRLAAQVVSGIGFLGAGTIMREGVTVRGLTTAASLWVVAGIGMAVGVGSYFPAIVTTLLVVVTLFFLSKLEKWLISGKRDTLVLEITDAPGQLGVIASLLGAGGVNIRGVNIDHNSKPTLMELAVEYPPKLDRFKIIAQLSTVPGVLSVRNR